MHLRGGADATLLDVSAAGAFIESRRRLVPGQRCALRFDVGPNGWLASGVVRRCSLVQPSGRHDVIHRIAVAFDRLEDDLWVVLTHEGSLLPD